MRRKKYQKALQELFDLNTQLEGQAVIDYHKEEQQILPCKKCKIKPIHSYDSFGMPMHKLECPECHMYVEYPKEMRGTITRWNGIQSGIAGTIKCENCKHHLLCPPGPHNIDYFKENNISLCEMPKLYSRCNHSYHKKKGEVITDPDYQLAITGIVNGRQDCDLFETK